MTMTETEKLKAEIDRIYNEIDPAAAASLQAIMDDGIIPPGLVDTRSIKELTHADLTGRHQAHFFAGAGAWAYVARLAGWPDWWPLWTGSCPCQPFSQAGRRAGTADARHLWPDFFRLIKASRPPVVVGEQVAGKAGYGWFDGVRSDLEGEGYSCRAVDIPACAVDAPNIRQRIYWVAVADAEHAGEGRRELFGPGEGANAAGVRASDQPSGRDGDRGNLVHASGERRGEGRAEPEFWSGRATTASADAPIALGDAFQPRLERQRRDGDGTRGRTIEVRSVAEADDGNLGHSASDGRQQGQSRSSIARYGDKPSAAHGRNGFFWSDHEWLICLDGKARRTKPGLRLLADGVAGRVHQWHIAGNGINIPLAVEVLAALKETLIEDGWKV